MPYVYIGRTHNHIGKTIWEIVGCLKNFGVGRMLVRNRFQRYEEPCYYRIVTAKPKMDELNREGEVFVEEVFRGMLSKELTKLSAPSYKTDYQLIPKHEEINYITRFKNHKAENIKIFPQTLEMPPLLKLYAKQRGLSETTLKMSLVTSTFTQSRVAEDGETPNQLIISSLGKPASPEFYDGVLEKYEQKADQPTGS